MAEALIKAFYLILPAYFANMAPVIFARLGWLNFLARPIDGGIKVGRNFVFGHSKTWRGLLSAVILATIVTASQALLFNYGFFRRISLINYQHYFILFGILAGAGAILGDLFKSFLKRRVGIASGNPWPVFDQLDFVLGFLLFTYWLVKPSWPIIIFLFVMTILLHPLTNITAYLLKIKKVWW